MRRFAAVLLVFALLAGMAAAQDSIRLGVNLELSGRFAVLGSTSLEGVEAAHLQNPTFNGIPIELSVCDNASTVEGSVACANRFIDEGVLAVLGPISTTHAIPAAEALQDAGVIMISDRKSTRLNSSHVAISYTVFCLKEKKTEWSQTF